MLALDCASLAKCLCCLLLGEIVMAESPIETQAVDRTGSPGVSPTNGVTSAPAHSDQDDDAQRLRGIVALPHQRQVLFTDEVELDAGKLPRWQPRINVAKRRLTDDDDE